MFDSLLAVVEKAVFGIGVLVGATSQHFVGPLGTEHIYRELCIVSWWEPHMCMSQPCVLAFGIHGRKDLFPGVHQVLRDTGSLLRELLKNLVLVGATYHFTHNTNLVQQSYSHIYIHMSERFGGSHYRRAR